ncbi:MAG: carboxypeptidase regulatory-like domain-containing protein [Saprospiraceae bacterium]|nr:carboxypeptidase regulatory-like domain-containing protein [Saprospiraceae bacterium]
MKRTFVYITSLLFAVTLACDEDTVAALGSGTLNGIVVSEATGLPIENAQIKLTPGVAFGFTDAAGLFSLEGVPEGDYSVEATKDGFLARFVSTTILPDQTSDVLIELQRDDANNRPPSAVNLLTPTNNEQNVPVLAEFLWNSAEDPDETDILSYRLIISEVGQANEIVYENISDTTFTANAFDLNFATNYTWQIGVSDGVNDEVLSSAFVFRTKDFPASEILYVRQENSNFVIYSTDKTGAVDSTFRVTDPNISSWRPRKNPDNSKIAFLRNVGSETHIFTQRPDGSELTQVTSIPVTGFRASEIDFSWSGNGDRLIYPNFNKLFVINADGSGLDELYSTSPDQFITECAWSPASDDLIAIKVNDLNGYQASILTIDDSGNELETILSNVDGAAGGLDIDDTEEFLIYSYDVSEEENQDYRQFCTKLFRYSFDDQASELVSPDGCPGDGTVDVDPRFSPTSAQLIFTNRSNDSSIGDIVVADFNGENRAVVVENAIMPDWNTAQ